MRTVEVIFVIAILLGAFAIATQFAILPAPRQAFGTNLRDLSQSTLETLDVQGVLSETIFKENSDSAWGNLQKAISASLPPNLVYNLSVYDLSEDSGGLVGYQLINSISDIGFGADSEAASLIVTSPDVTFTQDPQKIGESYGQNITLYILNCEDANGWWITGYTSQTLALDLFNLLGRYFETTVFINNTDELQLLIENSSSLDGNIQNAVVINTFGESVPIPDEYCLGGIHDEEGYGAGGSYARYCYTLGAKTREYNWTWVSIVGYPVYYVSNTEEFSNNQNTFGIYGMTKVGSAGLNSFLSGLDNKGYEYSSGGIDGSPGDVTFNNEALENINYYGIYPHPTQTSTRALSDSILEQYDLSATEIFNRPSWSDGHYIPAAIYAHNGGGTLAAIGLTRIPDIRVTALALLMYYHPTIYRNDFGASGTSRLVTLQLGQQGGT
jgi:hypothetical protein